MTQSGYPLQLDLPQGRAHYVGMIDDRPRYELDGALIDVDAEIPIDIASRWFWHGSFLRLNTVPGEPGRSICTRTFPPPECFDIARRQVLREREAQSRSAQLVMELL
jgi:hypothetical protein